MTTVNAMGDSDRQAEVKEWAVTLRMLLVAAKMSDRRMKGMEDDEIHLFLTNRPRLGERAILAMCDKGVIETMRKDATIRVQRRTAGLAVDHDTWYESKAHV